MEKLSNKERMKIPRQSMPEQDSVERAHNFKEVNLGFTEELAMLEAQRCLQCPKPSCVEGCPSEAIKIQDDKAVVNEQDCVDCGVCADECPAEAITPE